MGKLKKIDIISVVILIILVIFVTLTISKDIEERNDITNIENRYK